MVHFQKRNLGIEKIEKAEIDFTRNDLDTDTGKTFFLKAQKFGRTDRDIDDTALAERPAVSDTDDHPLHIGQIGDSSIPLFSDGPDGSGHSLCGIRQGFLLKVTQTDNLLFWGGQQAQIHAVVQAEPVPSG